ncbi:MAG: hypothetical protein ACFFCQ_10275 [Promethearchaeota archaeon]
MPHVVIKGDLQLSEIFKKLEPFVIKTDSKIIKTTKLYLSKDTSSILVETITIDTGKSISFLSMIGQRSDGVVIRLYPGTNVEKTDLVKQSISEIAKKILNLFSEVNIGKTNLQDYFK